MYKEEMHTFVYFFKLTTEHFIELYGLTDFAVLYKSFDKKLKKNKLIIIVTKCFQSLHHVPSSSNNFIFTLHQEMKGSRCLMTPWGLMDKGCFSMFQSSFMIKQIILITDILCIILKS